jgi:hypothetical protein
MVNLFIVMLCVIMQNVIMLTVIMLTAVVPFTQPISAHSSKTQRGH